MYSFSCNPEGPGFIRVRDEFVRPTQYGEKILEEEKTLRNGRTVIERRAFVQSSMDDNPFLDESYELQFDGMSEVERKKNVEGDWDVNDSNFFTKYNYKVHKIDDMSEVIKDYNKEYNNNREYPQHWKCYASMDWGFHPDPGVLQIHLVGDNKQVTRWSFKWNNKSITEVATYIRELEAKYNFKIEILILPWDMDKTDNNYSDNKGRVIGETKRAVLNYYGFHTVTERLPRKDGWDKCHDLMSLRNAQEEPIWYVHSDCHDLTTQFETLARDNSKYFDIREGQFDHDADAYRGWAVFQSKHIYTKFTVKKEVSWREMIVKSTRRQIDKGY
jgi:hypothetical protein